MRERGSTKGTKQVSKSKGKGFLALEKERKMRKGKSEGGEKGRGAGPRDICAVEVLSNRREGGY